MNEYELLEKVALDMVVHQYTKLGWSVDWCKDLFETNYRNTKTEYIELAKIALITLKSEPLSDD